MACMSGRTSCSSVCAPSSNAEPATPYRRIRWRPAMDDLDRRLLDRLQYGLPLEPNPFAIVAKKLKCSEEELLARLQRLLDDGTLTRFGPMFDIEPLGG